VAAIALPGAALAQTTPAAPAPQTLAESQEGALAGEVVVTARKREEKVQDIPISISAFSGASIKARGVDELKGVTNFTPNITFQSNPSFGGASDSAAIYIRGIGQKEFLPTTDPGVGVYIDGVYVARSVGADLDLVDVDHVEILRGPQGTLFGRNTIGGAISVTTVKPNDTPSASAQITGGSYSRIDSRFIGNLPITDTLYAKVSLAEYERDGYVAHPAADNELGNINTLTGRFDLRWKPRSNFEINVSLEDTRDYNNGPAVTLSGINLNSSVFNPHGLPLLPPGSPPQAGYYVANPPGDAPVDNFSLLNNYEAYYLGGQPCLTAQPYNPQGTNAAACYNNRFVSSTTNYGTGPSYSHQNTIGTSVTIDWDLGPVQLKSITAYRDVRGKYARDGDDSPLNIVSFFDNLSDGQVSQEFQVLGQTDNKKLKYVVGLYYFNETGNDINILNFLPAYFTSGGKFDTTSYAAFGQATWEFIPTWDLTVGLRYTDDRKSFLPDQLILADRTPGELLLAGSPNTPAARILPYVTVDRDDSDVSPTANLAWHITPGAMIYASVSQGYKSGGFVQRVFPPLPATPEFGPETAWTYEIGAKTSWLDRRLTVDGALFYTDYKNLQVQVFQGVAPVTENAAAARIEGAELESHFNVGSGWFIEGSLGYLDPKYTKINPSAIEITLNSKFERVSAWTLNASLSKTLDLKGYGDLVGRIDWSYRTGFFMDALNSPELYQPGYHLVNANVAYNFPNGKMSLIVGVTNLTDTKYTETGIYDTSFGQYEQVFARPREWYVTAKWRL